MPSQQSEPDESLEVVEPVPIKLEPEALEVDIATAPAPEQSEPKSKPASKPEPQSADTAPPRQDASLESEAEPVISNEPKASENESNVEPTEPGDEAPFEYSSAGFAILDEVFQLAGSTACGNQEGCFQVDESFRDASEDLEALFKRQGYESNEIQVAEDSAYKAYRLTSLENPDLTQYLYVLNREIDNGPGQFPDIVTFYLVTQEAQTLDDLNQKLATN